jgi:hypothetical protein
MIALRNKSNINRVAAAAYSAIGELSDDKSNRCLMHEKYLFATLTTLTQKLMSFPYTKTDEFPPYHLRTKIVHVEREQHIGMRTQ